MLSEAPSALDCSGRGVRDVYFEQIRVFQGRPVALNTLAWNNGIGLSFVLFCWFSGPAVMIERDSWGHSYLIVRGEILGFMKDEQVRKHLPRMFSLIKNESWGFEDDQIPS